MSKDTRRLVSVQVGSPQTREVRGKEWRSAIFKQAVSGRVRLEKTNLDGDKQANLKYHGGPDKAVCCYPAEHYPYWQTTFGMGDDFAYGAFGENFTVAGMTEAEVCIGDVYAVGTARIQVCQPRVPCVNVARKWDRKDLPARMEATDYTGYYVRVLQTGEVGTEDAMTLLERPHPEMTLLLLNRALYQQEWTPELRAQVIALPELAASARRMFQRLS